MKYRAAFSFLLLVLLVDAACKLSGVYGPYPSVDIPLHLAGGLGTGMLALAVHDDFKRRHKIGKTPRWYDLLFTLGFVSLVAIAWEFHEFVLDRTLIANYQLAVSQLSIADTIGDFLNGLLGGGASFFLFTRSRSKS